MRSWRQFLDASDWNPGLDNGHRRLGDVLATLPGAAQEEIHWLVRLIENPKSPLAFPGQISLARHDALHVLLGRGLNNQDEAFVIGFTMGAAQATRRWQCRLFSWLASTLYPSAYRFEPEHRQVFELGVGQGWQHPVQDIHLLPIETMLDDTVDAVRERVGIRIHDLHAAYRHERILVPHTPESARLDTDYGGVDPSAIQPPK